MRFKVDENLHDDVASLLANHGHDVETVRTEGLRGHEDDALLDRCRQEDRAIVTLDVDFADIRAYPPASNKGIVVVRVRNQSRPNVLRVMTRVLDLLEREPLTGQLWIASDADIRIRRG
jgi:predicted nuclease of predicted toxin-antitoxin system